ncbi:Uncharacterised protein [Streptococcus pneumoniae]|nr:Uncharacterised protein [Streptococcus pneumoniae]
MEGETWFDARSAVNHGFADKVMFESQEAPVLVASQTPVIPRDFIEKIRSAMTPDVELLADLVRDRLKIRKKKTRRLNLWGWVVSHFKKGNKKQ